MKYPGLDEVFPPQAMVIRIDHTRELIEMFNGYVKAHPQHSEYYGSIIYHLEAIIEGYEKQQKQLQEFTECPKPNQVH